MLSATAQWPELQPLAVHNGRSEITSTSCHFQRLTEKQSRSKVKRKNGKAKICWSSPVGFSRNSLGTFFLHCAKANDIDWNWCLVVRHDAKWVHIGRVLSLFEKHASRSRQALVRISPDPSGIGLFFFYKSHMTASQELDQPSLPNVAATHRSN